MKLQTLIRHDDGQFTARWSDEHELAWLTFNAVHAPRLVAAGGGARAWWTLA